MTARQSAASERSQRASGPANATAMSAASPALRSDLLEYEERLRASKRPTCAWRNQTSTWSPTGSSSEARDSLLNALIEEKILPGGVVSLTAVVTVLKHGRPEAVGVYADGRHGEVDARRLARGQASSMASTQ